MWDCPVLKSTPCCMSSLPQLPVSAPPTSRDVCFFFNSCVVRLPYGSIFWQLWLFFVFKFVVVLLLVVQEGKVYLPTPPSWLEGLLAFFLSERFVSQQVISRIWWTVNLLRTDKRYRRVRPYAEGSSQWVKQKIQYSQHYSWKFPPSFIKSTLSTSSPACLPRGLEQSMVSPMGSWWNHPGATIYEALCLQPENHSSKWDILAGKGK